MNIYGDRGNILCLERRCRERGIGFEVTELGLGEKLKPKEYDLIFIGGAQDREQRRVAEDLVKVKGKALREAAGMGVAVLAGGGGYQLPGRACCGGTGVSTSPPWTPGWRRRRTPPPCAWPPVAVSSPCRRKPPSLWLKTCRPPAPWRATRRRSAVPSGAAPGAAASCRPGGVGPP